MSAHDEYHHAPPPWWRRYIFSVDHKTIGIQYAITALLFLMLGFGLMMVMRYQLAYPHQRISEQPRAEDGDPLGAPGAIELSGVGKQAFYVTVRAEGQGRFSLDGYADQGRSERVFRTDAVGPGETATVEAVDESGIGGSIALGESPGAGDRGTIDYRVKQAPAFLEAPMQWLGSQVDGISAEGHLTGEMYNQFGAMHGTIMVFLAIVPLVVGGFGNYLVPLQIGAPDMAFPRLNMASYWVYFMGGVVMLGSFFLPGGAAQSGWTSYPPMANIMPMGQTFWLLGMVFLITSSLLGSMNILVTIIQMRAEGLSFFRLPFFVWAQFVTSFLLLLAFPPLEAAGVLQLMDRVAGTSFFMPTGLVITDQTMAQLGWTGGGNHLLWQHLFWFLAHPEVYVLILPAFGIVTEVVANNIRKPIWGYKTMVYAVLFLGFMSFIVWAHHMFLTGMGTTMATFFQATTMIISIPSVILLTCLVISLYGGAIRYKVPMLFALAFLPMFAIGGLTGLPLGLTATDIHLHDTYYVIGHFHYVVAPGTIFAIFAGIYYWYPKATGRKMNELLGHLHFWPSFLFMNVIFLPMMFVGMAGVSRRLYDQTLYEHGTAVQGLTSMSSWGAWLLFVAQIPFIINFFWSLKGGDEVEDDNPWEATTLEWATPTPPGHGNFLVKPVVDQGPYAYGEKTEDGKDFLVQSPNATEAAVKARAGKPVEPEEAEEAEEQEKEEKEEEKGEEKEEKEEKDEEEEEASGDEEDASEEETDGESDEEEADEADEADAGEEEE